MSTNPIPIACYKAKIPVYFYIEQFTELASIPNEIHLSLSNDGHCNGTSCYSCPIGPDCSNLTNFEWMLKLCPETESLYPELLI